MCSHGKCRTECGPCRREDRVLDLEQSLCFIRAVLTARMCGDKPTTTDAMLVIEIDRTLGPPRRKL